MDAQSTERFLDTILFQHTGKHLDNLQTEIFQLSWQGKGYKQIAKELEFAEQHVKDVGAKLWKSLTEALGERVTKTNFKAVLERRSQSDQAVSNQPRRDWGDAPDIEPFYGRTQELATLEKWMIEDKCRLVSLLGMGGIGKTSLAIKLAQKIQNYFDYVIWRSLCYAPSITEMLSDLIKTLSGQQQTELLTDSFEDENINRKISILIADYLQKKRCLLVFDSVNDILEPGDCTLAGVYRQDCEGYRELISQVIKIPHQSCLVLTSRENPLGVQGGNNSVRALNVSGLDEEDALVFFQGETFSSTSHDDLRRIIRHFGGNPLIIEQIPNYIQNVLYGDIAEYMRALQAGELVYQNYNNVFDRQFERLSILEKNIVYWLTINREPISFEELLEDLNDTPSKFEIRSSLYSLSKGKSLIEETSKGYTLQPAVMDCMTHKILDQVYQEVVTGQISLLGSHSLLKAQSKVYIQNAQDRFIVEPLKNKLIEEYKDLEQLDNKLIKILEFLRGQEQNNIRCAAGNILNLLVHCHSDYYQKPVELRGHNFSDLRVEQSDFTNAELHDVNFTNANLDKSIFRDIFSNILCVCFSPNGRFLATGDGNHKIHIWKISDGKKIRTFKGHTDWVRSVAFNKDSSILASASGDKTIKLWDVATGECLKTLEGHQERVRAIAFSPDDSILASASADRTVRLWDMRTYQCLAILKKHEDRVRDVAFSPDGKILASAGEDKLIKLWDVRTRKFLKDLKGHTDWVRSITFHPNGKLLASGSEDKTIKLWNPHTGKCLKTLEGHDDCVRSLSFSPEDQKLASGSSDWTVKLWDVNTGECLNTLQGHFHWVRSVAFSPDGKILATGSPDQTVRLWGAKRGRCLKIWRGYTNWIRSVRFSPNGQTIASTSTEHTVRLWDVKTGKCLQTFYRVTDWLQSIRFSPNGKFLAIGSADKTAKILSATTGQYIRKFQGHHGRVLQIAFHPKGNILATSSDDRTVKLWDVETGQCLKTLSGHKNRVRCINFNSDGTLLATGSEDFTVKLWNPETGECLDTLQGHEKRICSVAFSQDNSLLASGSADCTIKLWKVASGEEITTLSGHEGRIFSIAFQPKKRGILASSSEDTTVRLWGTKKDNNQFELLKVLADHQNSVVSLAFNPDGTILATASHDETIRLWNVATGECIRILAVPKPYEGMNIAGVKGLTEAEIATLKALGAVEKWE